jgi:hypothetical protein
MMKALILLTLVAYVAAQASVEYVGVVGYETKVEVAKDSGVGYIQLVLPAAEFPLAGSSLELWLRVLPKADALSAGGAQVDFWITDTKPASLTGNPTFAKAADASFANYDHRVGKSNTTKTVWITARSTACKSCSSTLEIKIGFWLIHNNPNPVPTKTVLTRDFELRDNSYTADYTLAKGTWGASGRVTIKDVNLFVAVDGPTLGDTIIVFSKVKPVQGDDWKKVENNDYKPIGLKSDGTGTRGNYRSGGRFVSNGDWFVTPYCSDIDLSRSDVTFDFAIGLGHEPSSSSIAVPSLVSLVLIAVAFFKAL